MSAGDVLLRATVDSMFVILGGVLVAVSMPLLEPYEKRLLRVIVCLVDLWIFTLMIAVGIWVWFA